MFKTTCFVAKGHKDQLEYWSKIYKLPVSRLIAIAVDNELQRDKPFYLNLELPENDYIEFAFAEEAGKILTFMKTRTHTVGLDMLLIMRSDIGVPDKEIFLSAFRDLLDRGLIKAVPPPPSDFTVQPDENYKHYVVKGKKALTRKAMRRKGNRYEEYQKLKKEFGNE